ncbi:type II secretion system F family protein [Shewanella sp. VB17]|uniref:type II secretion system F family protein n=1 Tax=Shewanella sp. VB17 TaxID=2739432 RepID=UPI0020B86B1F|nr:type II secretion system F family protein [Shewanella sp. VB17]
MLALLVMLLGGSLIVSVMSCWHYYGQYRLKCARLLIVSVAKTRDKSVSKSLFGLEQETSPWLRWLKRLESRIDNLFGVKGKVFLYVGLIVAGVSSWLMSGFLPYYVRFILVLIVPAVAFLGFFWFMRTAQLKQFDHAFPQVLGQLSRAVAAGISVPQAIAQVSEYQQGFLCREFELISDSLTIGISLKQALQQASHRLPYASFHFFTVALILNQENGGQLREVLYRLGRTLHDNSAIKMKIKSLTAEPRITALILASLPLVLIGIMCFKNPSSFAILIDTPVGQYVLLYVLSSIVLGLSIINVLTKVRP